MTTKKATVTDRTTNPINLFERACLLTFHRHYLGNKRKIDVDDLVEAAGGKMEDSDVEESVVRATKTLLDPKELTPVRSVQNRARARLRSIAIAAHRSFGESTYVIGKDLVERINNDLNELHDELKLEAAALAARYVAAVERQKIKLGPLFKESDYVTPERVVEAFDFEWWFVEFSTPKLLTSVSSAIAESEQKKHEARLRSAFDEVLVGLRASALDVVSDLCDRLAPDESGRKRAIRSTALDALRQFAELLPHRNLADDDKLAKAVDTLVARAKGIDAETLRDSEQVRKGLLDAAETAKKTLAALVESGPRRAIKLPTAAA